MSMSIEKKYGALTNACGFLVPLTVQLGMVSIAMAALAATPALSAGYVALGVNAVLFAPRAFQKFLISESKLDKLRYLLNWALFAAFSIFIGISFSLSGTLEQTESARVSVTVENDAVLVELRASRAAAQAKSEKLNVEYDQTIGKEQLNAIQSRQKSNDAEIERLQRAIEARIAAVESGEITEARRGEVRTSAQTIFQSIPAAATDGRIMQLIFWAVIMIGTELSIINSLTEAKDSPAARKPVAKIDRKPVAKNHRKRLLDGLPAFTATLFKAATGKLAITAADIAALIEMPREDITAYVTYAAGLRLIRLEKSGAFYPIVTAEVFQLKLRHKISKSN